jgi:hypothetical protein
MPHLPNGGSRAYVIGLAKPYPDHLKDYRNVFRNDLGMGAG